MDKSRRRRTSNKPASWNLVCVMTHTSLHEIDEHSQSQTARCVGKKKKPRSTKTMMINVITNLARIFCGALHHSIVPLECLAVTLQGAHWRRNRQTLNARTHAVSKETKNIQILPSYSLDWAWRVFLFIMSCAGLQVIFKLLTVSFHASNIGPSFTCCLILNQNFRHSFVHLARRCHLGSHFARRTMPRVFPPWGSKLRPDPRFRRHGYASTVSWKLSSRICASVSRRTSAWCSCAEWLALVCNPKMWRKTHSRSECFSSHVESPASACIQRQVGLFQSRRAQLDWTWPDSVAFYCAQRIFSNALCSLTSTSLELWLWSA